jgi:hemerythrin
MKIAWDETNEVGIEAIDRQHKHFLGIVNKIFKLSAARNDATKPELVALLSDLAGYSVYHFSTEEAYFKEYKYTGAKEHMAAHDLFCEKVSELLERAENPKTNLNDLSEEIANYSVDWLTHHTLAMDLVFAKWLKKQKIQIR